MGSNTMKLIQLFCVILQVIVIFLNVIKDLIVSKDLVNCGVWNFTNELHALMTFLSFH
jgi:hypothetical protein